MLSTNYLDQNIQHLINANYQRMMAFEQAAFVSDESSLKSFFEARADESENNLKELCSILNIPAAEVEKLALQNSGEAEKVSSVFSVNKNAVKLIQSVKTLEKTILSWYKNTIKEIKSLPKEIVATVSMQYKAIMDAEMQLQYL